MLDFILQLKGVLGCEMFENPGYRQCSCKWNYSMELRKKIQIKDSADVNANLRVRWKKDTHHNYGSDLLCSKQCYSTDQLSLQAFSLQQYPIGKNRWCLGAMITLCSNMKPSKERQCRGHEKPTKVDEIFFSSSAVKEKPWFWKNVSVPMTAQNNRKQKRYETNPRLCMQ